jgi:hypothetical protein
VDEHPMDGHIQYPACTMNGRVKSLTAPAHG